jgi:hypothetical protein
VLFFIEHGTRLVRIAGVRANPVCGWVTQQARNFCFDLTERTTPAKFLIRDRDTKFTSTFDAVFAGEGIRIIKTPIRAPRANAIAERFAGTIRGECLDRLLILGRRHLEVVLAEYVDHYNGHRPHRSLDPTVPLDGHRSDRPDRRSRPRWHTTNRRPWRAHPRVPPRRLSWRDGVLGTYTFFVHFKRNYAAVHPLMTWRTSLTPPFYPPPMRILFVPTLCVPKTSSGLVTWTNVLRLLEPSTDDLAADSQDPTTGNTGSATVAPWWDCLTA